MSVVKMLDSVYLQGEIVLLKHGKYSMERSVFGYSIDITGIGKVTVPCEVVSVLDEDELPNQTLEEQLADARALLSVAGKRIDHLAEQVELLESKEVKDLIYCIDGWHCEYVESNYGGARPWQRHLSNAYQK